MRKISPHLTIYKFPITAISSISTRLSGMYITGLGLLYISYDFLNEKTKIKYESIYYNTNYNYKKIINCIFLYPIGYHITGGIRHLIWDKYPALLTNKRVTKSSNLLFITAFIPTLLIEKMLKLNN